MRQLSVGVHHNRQFGDKSLADRALKLGEEAGELQGAVVRHTERRDGREWLYEIEEEAGDVYIVLLNLLDKAGLDANGVFADAEDRFLAREWNVDK